MSIKAIFAGIGAFFVALSGILLKILFNKNEKIKELEKSVKKEEANKEALKEFNEEEREINKKKEEVDKQIQEVKTDEDAFKIAADIVADNNKRVRKHTKRDDNTSPKA